MRRALFTGSRDWTDEASVRAVIDSLPADAVVIHGAARGLDAIVDRLARARGLRVRACAANWEMHDGACECPGSARYCRNAGPRRNQRMLDDWQPTECHAFPLPGSRGTWDMVSRCRRARVPVTIHKQGAA